ncbi:glutathione S-transferase family protein [Methylobacterium sp. J-001]|uniref:glutathione S-transferase family protein n=1 Tax=Methylobacterium sp. J-001 TaxID=2836609 RepID=UPI001FBB1E5C|nr:glutathione S-transferase family protein [Methylobacterium sp. J-001]MCJ2115121.1 glutathione S-transferase family protein [Methylobacterium sp. J-001]
MPQPALVLHHYGSSPYSEKIRLAFGIKGLHWASVEIAALPPRPLLDPLTGGYRRVPVLQVGADIYCDTNVILPALDRLASGPSLYAGLPAGLSKAATFGFERDVWLAAIGVRVHFTGDGPADFLRDRKEDYLYIDMSHAAMEPDYLRHRQRVAAHVAWLADALSDPGRPFLGGNQPGALDLGYFHVLWLMRNGPHAEAVDHALGLEPILPWYARVTALGHGRPTALSPEAALTLARDAEPAPIEMRVAGMEAPGLAVGRAVTVTPDDFARIPVRGSLLALDAERIVIRREDEKVGTIHLHFPRAGFEVAAIA